MEAINRDNLAQPSGWAVGPSNRAWVRDATTYTMAQFQLHLAPIRATALIIVSDLLDWSSIPFHRFMSGNEAHTDETNIIQKDRESVQSTENT